MMAFTQENIVSSTQGNAENYLGTSRESFDSLGAAGVQLCSVNCAKVSPLPSMKPQIAKFNVKEKLDQKKVQKNKSKNAKKKEKNKKKQKQNQLDKCFEGDEAFKETVNTLEMITGHIKDLILKRRRLLTVGRISGILNSIIEFLQTIDKKCLTKPNKVLIVKPFLTDIVSQMHLLYSDLRKVNTKFNSDKERHNYLNKVSDLLAMIIDLEITTAKIYLCKKCEGKSFRTEAILKNHLKKIHKIKTSTGDWWTDDNDSNSYIGIAEGQREKLVSMLTSSLYTYLDNSSNHIIDTMLKTTNKNKNKASKIFSRIFSRILRAPAAGLSIVEYARHVLAFKMWKKMLDSHQAQREVTRLAAARLPLPPPLFRERVAVLEGIMPYVPPSTPDHAVTVYCLSVLSVRGIKYELKDQLQKYLLLISNPHRYTELLKHSKVFSENRNDFDVKDSIFAVDEEDMIFYDTFPPESPTKNTTSNKKGAEKKSADKKSVDRKSAEKKSSDKKCKSSATVTVDGQRDSNLVAADPSELVTSSNEFQHTLSETKIKTEILDELDAEDKVCAEEETAVTCAEECEEVTEVAHDLTDRTSCDQKRTDIQIKRKLVEDKYSDQKYLNRVWPEKKTQIVTPFAASSGLCATNLKPPCDDPMPLDLQKSCDNAMQLDLHKSCDNAMLLDLHKSCDDGMPLDLHKSCDNALPLDLHKSCDNTMPLVLPNLCDPWSPDLFGEMEKCIDENALDDADDMAIDADDRLAMKIKQELSELKADAFERRKSTLQEDDFTEEFSEQSTGELSCDIINLLNSPDTAVFDLLTKNTPDSRWFSMIMDVDMEDVIGNDASNCFKVDYRLPIKHLGDWFPLETVAKKREEIDRFVPDLSRAPSKPLDSLGAVAVLEDCNTSQDVTNDFCGFDLDQPLHGLLSADHRTDHFLNDDDDNAVMDVIERPVTPRPTPTPQLCVTLSRCSVEYVSPPLKKKRGRRRTAAPSTALKTLSTVKRKILGSEKPIATRKRMVNSSSATRKSTGNSTSLRKTPGSVNSTSPKKETAGLKNPTSPRKTAVLENSTSPRKTAVLENSTTSPRKTASPEKSIATRKTTAVPENSTAAAKKSSTSKKNEPDNSTLIPLRKPVVNEYWKNIQKQDKQNSRRCSK